MTAANVAYKIKDSKTGLYWGGRKGCVEKIGTRFVTISALNSTILNIKKDKRGIWPSHWMIETVRLTETVIAVRTGNQVIIDYAFLDLIKEAIAARGADYYYADAAAVIIDKMRIAGGFSAPYMVLVPPLDIHGNTLRPKDLRAFVKGHGGDPTKIDKKARGWWTVQDLSTATLLRLNSDVTMMIDVMKNVEIVATRLHTSPEELIRAA